MKFPVNVPVSALVKLSIARMLREARPRADNWPGIILEVGEDQNIKDLALADDVAGSLRELKCTLAFDDFAAGYSALARSQQLPFSEFNIHRGYVANCHPLNARLCEVIVEFARHFGLATVAGHRDRARERHKLQGLGCYAGQGELFGNPMPKGQLIGLMRNRLVGAPAAGYAAAKV